EYDSPRWSLRGAEALMPTVANGIVLDWHLARARGENLELELRPHPGTTVRVLTYMNHANMGSYAEAINAYRAGRDPVPDIEAHRRQGRVKEGVTGSTEHVLPYHVRAFTRFGWNEGEHESFAYTEVNNTASTGADISGHAWHRPLDRAGLVLVSNGLS